MSDVIGSEADQEANVVREEGTASYNLMTATEYLNAEGMPEHSELVRGRVIEMTPPSGRHGQVCYRIAFLLGCHAEKHQSGHVLINDTGVQTTTDPDTVRGGDVAYLSFKKQPKGPLPDDYDYPVPEVIFEVLSKTDRWPEVFAKVAEYLTAGIEVVAIVEPELGSVRCFRADGTDQLHAHESTIQIPEIQPTFECQITEFF